MRLNRVLRATGPAAAFALAASIACAGGLDEAQRLLDTGNLAAAHRAASAISPATRDEALQRQWILARSLLRQNAPRAALVHLERLVSDAPQVVRFRLELARTLVLIADDDRARLHFDRALGAPLAPQEVAAVRHYLSVIDGRRTWSAGLSFQIAPESNAVRGTSDTTVDLPFGVVPIPESSQARPGTGAEVSANAAWLPHVAPSLRARLAVSASARVFSDSALNSQSLRLEGGGILTRDRGTQFGLGLSAQAQFAGGARVMDGRGIYATWSGRPAPAMQLSGRLEMDDLRFANVPGRNGQRRAISGQLIYAWSPQLLLRGSLHLIHHRAAQEFHSRIDYGASFGGQYAFEGGLVGSMTLSLGAGQADGRSPLFGVVQSDTRAALTGQIMHRDLSVMGFAPVLELGLEQQRSNIPTARYDNARMSLGVTRQF
ncbi:surface lipoprotein assembly modifier [Roseicitreum antarcticum]|uniref:Surface lipoprotein assembly modifier C-terminal domain-containing protein n=1 Tax=Roseicitreum antarcticum TaxID=564137 RepID=A0A1H3C6U8_9RHOB|nr:surface lipoprotein assembly modifier [Roseicitreum antarcticum]SDX49882.1 Protein of unknown function [Roseicitreum antarcticum]